jgi:hypothetical protein
MGPATSLGAFVAHRDRALPSRDWGSLGVVLGVWCVNLAASVLDFAISGEFDSADCALSVVCCSSSWPRIGAPTHPGAWLALWVSVVPWPSASRGRLSSSCSSALCLTWGLQVLRLIRRVRVLGVLAHWG